MTNFFTPEEKKYLGFLSRYLISIGMDVAEITYLYEHEYQELLDVNTETHFSNNYSEEIPEKLYPILKKIMDYVEKNDLISIPEEASGTSRIEVIIKSKERTISLDCDYYIMEVSPSSSGTIEFDDEEIMKDEELKQVFELLGELDPNQEEFQLRVSGGGDSGYIEDYFEDVLLPVPDPIQDWGYEVLNSNFTGWENNEGGQGYFLFKMEPKFALLDMEINVERMVNDEIFEIKF